VPVRDAGTVRPAAPDQQRSLARLIGALLAEAHVGSALFADAHPVAVAVESGGGVVQTADPVI
jgi:hypothetical protein